MQVYGDLVRLPEDGALFPLPWHCRAPLGLKSGSSVHLALLAPLNAQDAADGVASEDVIARPPDLIATVLDPQVWNRTRKLIFTGSDRPRILFAVLQAIGEWNLSHPVHRLNVVLGESMTLTHVDGETKSGNHHETCLLIEPELPEQNPRAAPFIDEAVGQIKTKLMAGGKFSLKAFPFAVPGRLIRYLGCPPMERGCAKLPTSWRELRAELADAAPLTNQCFDFQNAAFSADLESRLVRAVFPVRGARRLIVTHRNVPNTFLAVTDAIARNHYNILTSHLRQGGAGANTATIVAVCEPTPAAGQTADHSLQAAALADDLKKQAEGPGPFVVVQIEPAVSYERALFPGLSHGTLLGQLGRFSRFFTTAEGRDLIHQTVQAVRANNELLSTDAVTLTREIVLPILKNLRNLSPLEVREILSSMAEAVSPRMGSENHLATLASLAAKYHDVSRKDKGLLWAFVQTAASDRFDSLDKMVRHQLQENGIKIHDADLIGDPQQRAAMLMASDAVMIVARSLPCDGAEGDPARTARCLETLGFASALSNHRTTTFAFEFETIQFPLWVGKHLRVVPFSSKAFIKLVAQVQNATEEDVSDIESEDAANEYSFPVILNQWLGQLNSLA